MNKIGYKSKIMDFIFILHKIHKMEEGKENVFEGIMTLGMEKSDSKSENDLPVRMRSFTFNSCEGEEIMISKP